MSVFGNIGNIGKFDGLGLLGIDAATLAFNDVAFDDPMALGLLGSDLAMAGLGWGLEKDAQKREHQPA